jgi:hypothetical protein
MNMNSRGNAWRGFWYSSTHMNDRKAVTDDKETASFSTSVKALAIAVRVLIKNSVNLSISSSAYIVGTGKGRFASISYSVSYSMLITNPVSAPATKLTTIAMASDSENTIVSSRYSMSINTTQNPGESRFFLCLTYKIVFWLELLSVFQQFIGDIFGVILSRLTDLVDNILIERKKRKYERRKEHLQELKENCLKPLRDELSRLREHFEFNENKNPFY